MGEVKDGVDGSGKKGENNEGNETGVRIEEIEWEVNGG